VVDNVNMSDVDFEDVFVGHGEKHGDNFGQRGNYRYQDHISKLCEDLGTIKLKISVFQGKNDPEVYLE
jgi:hypothetical protein